MDRNLLLLVKMEHTESVWKLNFVSSLTDAILEVISARGTPFTVLTDSVAIRQNEDLLADQIGLKSDELRKMEQLVLLVKALRALKLPLLFARGEIRVGHLKSSNAVKNVLNDLNSRYHQCLDTCMREILSRIKSAFCNIIALVLLLFTLRLA
nr:serine/threonine-protein kinase ULK2-like [Pocillopora verrucosa]